MSRARPILSNRSLGMRHRGHGHIPLSRIVAIKTLSIFHGQLQAIVSRIIGHLLLRVVSRVCENSRIDLLHNAIMAFNDNTIFVCMKEIVVKYNSPDTMHKFLMAVCKNFLLLSIPFGMD